MARVGPTEYADALKRPHVREMDFTGKPMKGYVYVDAAGFESDTGLSKWVGLCLRLNESLPQNDNPTWITAPLGNPAVSKRRLIADMHLQRGLLPVFTIITSSGDGGVRVPLHSMCVL